MFGMLFEMLNEDAIGTGPVVDTASPRVTAIAHVRTNPVARESSVAPDIAAVERAMEGDAGGVPSAVSVSEMVASC